MVIMMLERVPASLRGELTRWFLEPKTGVFVGTVSAVVRDTLWEHACDRLKGGAGMMIYSANTEQGFAIRYSGEPRRTVRDFDGLSLICLPV